MKLPFADLVETWTAPPKTLRKGFWWSRRDSNPRPESFPDSVDMLNLWRCGPDLNRHPLDRQSRTFAVMLPHRFEKLPVSPRRHRWSVLALRSMYRARDITPNPPCHDGLVPGCVWQIPHRGYIEGPGVFRRLWLCTPNPEPKLRTCHVLTSIGCGSPDSNRRVSEL